MRSCYPRIPSRDGSPRMTRQGGPREVLHERQRRPEIESGDIRSGKIRGCRGRRPPAPGRPRHRMGKSLAGAVACLRPCRAVRRPRPLRSLPSVAGLAARHPARRFRRRYRRRPRPRRVAPGAARLAAQPAGAARRRARGGHTPPLLRLAQAANDFSRIDAQTFKAAATVPAGHRLAVEQDGVALAAWPIAVVPDVPPTIGFASPPQPTQRAALRLEYQASDDYGIDSVKAVITRKGGPPDEKIELDLPLPGAHPKEAKAASFHDLTPHIWAGLPVEIRLRASDAAGQVGESEPFAMTLPERGFQHPIARAIIEQRRQLTLTPNERQAVS